MKFAFGLFNYRNLKAKIIIDLMLCSILKRHVYELLLKRKKC